MDSTGARYNSTNTILMVRPSNFGSNPQTLADNAFQEDPNTNNKQQQNEKTTLDIIKNKGRQQFDNYVKVLRQNGINVIVVQDTSSPIKPDAIFPNNWFTTHTNNSIILYPMKPASRRPQRTNPVIAQFEKIYKIQKIHDLSSYQEKGVFLQGTGSMVFDHQNKIAYACVSQRTHEQLFVKVCKQNIGYEPVFFEACDSKGKRYYHTNVVMSVCSDFVVVGLQQILPQHRQKIKQKIQHSKGRTSPPEHKLLIQISQQQINNFCGNILQVVNKSNQKILTMSQTAYNKFTKQQLQIMGRYCKIVRVQIPNIQMYGGGGTRCMMAEVFMKL